MFSILNSFKSNMDIRIQEGSLADFSADVIVNSTNAALFLKHGGISRTILHRAGPGLQDVCSKDYPSGISFGDLAITDGFKLKCKKVFHVALPHWDSEFADATQTLCMTVCACLQEANKLKMASIAFPALGCGFLSYPHDKAAETMFQCISTFETETTKSTIKNVTIVIWNKGSDWKHIRQSFTQELRRHGNPQKKTPLTNSLTLKASTRKGDFLSTCIRESAQNACKKVLPCGHVCGGYKKERVCLPCLQPDCANGGQTSQEDCIICYTDHIEAAPAIKLGCGHIFHLHCAKRILQNRWVGPRINFNFTQCPICKATIEHTELDELMRPIKQLEDDVRQKATARLTYEGLDSDPAVKNQGGQFYNKPTDFAMERYIYYCCFKCKKAYFGGTARTECGADATEEFKPEDLVCPGCRGYKRPSDRRQPPSDKVVADRINSRQRAAAAKVIKETTKACPHCGVRTEKNGGCMHMTCIKCRGDWCWMCEKHWEYSCQKTHWFG